MNHKDIFNDYPIKVGDIFSVPEAKENNKNQEILNKRISPKDYQIGDLIKDRIIFLSCDQCGDQDFYEILEINGYDIHRAIFVELHVWYSKWTDIPDDGIIKINEIAYFNSIQVNTIFGVKEHIYPYPTPNVRMYEWFI